jgi:hypothetical protein
MKHYDGFGVGEDPEAPFRWDSYVFEEGLNGNLQLRLFEVFGARKGLKRMQTGRVD